MSSPGHVMWVYLLAGFAIQTAWAQHYVDEYNLRTSVLSGYQYKIRPETTVTCNVRLSLLNINILDVTGQRLSVSGWLTIVWNDTRLNWTASDYGGITDFYDTELVLWRPEIIVDNEITNLQIIESDKLLIRVTNEGVLTWEPPAIYQTHCDVDVTYYPFDTQLCIIEVTSWGYTLDEVNLEARDTAIYLEDFQLSGEWEILDSWSERRVLVDGLDSHSQVDFNMKLRRRPTYYVMTILIPVIVTSILSILVFLLPAESGEKVGYALTILLTYVVMLTLVAGYMPPTSKSTSVLSIYLTIVLFIGVFATLATVIVLYYHHHDNEVPVPGYWQNLCTKWLIPISSWKRVGSSNSNSSTAGCDAEDMNGFTSRPTTDRNKVHPKTLSGNNSKRDSKVNLEKHLTSSQDKLSSSTPIITWQELSVIVDAALFKVLSIFILLLTVAVVFALIVGGYS